MSSLDWDGSRAVTLGGWVRLVDTRGWTDESVWLVVHDAARAALSAVRRSLRPGEAEELVAEVVVVARGVPESWRVPDRAGVVLVRWLGGVMKRRLLAMRRAEFALAGENLTDVEGPDPPDDTGTREPPSVDAAALLTEKQLATWESACRGLGSRTAARQLGITRGAYRDRLRRAKGRRASSVPAPAPHDASQTAMLAKHVAERGDARNAARLVLRSCGTSYRSCAEALGWTVEAVRSRLARLWRRWKPSLNPQPRDTDLPCPTLPSRERESSPPEGGSTDGVPPAAVARGRAVRASTVGRRLGPERAAHGRVPDRGG